MIYPNDITSLKTDISQKIGQKIIVKGSLGRNKPFEKEAVIEKAYPCMFIVKYDETQENATYQYTDILTSPPQPQALAGQEHCPTKPPDSQGKNKSQAYDIA